MINYPAEPLPYQIEFHKSNKKYRCVIGGWGCGKTTMGVLEVIKLSLLYPGNFGLIARADTKRLVMTTLAELENYLPSKLVAEHNKHRQLITLFNGSQIAYMGVAEEYDAKDKIQSMNLGFFYIDQAEEVSYDIFVLLKGRLRKANTSRQGFLTCNAAGKNWIYKVFIEKDPDYVSNPEDYQGWVIKSYENKYLPQDYIAELNKLPESIKRRYVDCEFDDWEGFIFNAKWETEVFDRAYYTIPENSEFIFIGIDYAYRFPSAAVFIAVTKDRKVIAFDEIYENKLTVRELADKIKEKIAYYGILKYTAIIDPATKQKNGITGTSVYEELNMYLPVILGNNSISASISRIQELLNKGKLKISVNCRNLQREIKNWQWQDAEKESLEIEKGKEKPREGNDHAIDCLRYVVNYIYDVGLSERKDIVTPGEYFAKLEKKRDIMFRRRLRKLGKIKYIGEQSWML